VHPDRPASLATLLEESGKGHRPIATSAIRARRGDRSQVEIAQEAGISQGYLSELESGLKPLTPGVAQRLAPALGITADELLLSAHLAKLHQSAQKGRIDIQPLLAEAERLTKVLPSGEIGDAVIDALVGILRERSKPLN
jgi:transcriptional regulator with XRE-family HTH domain